MSTDPIITCDGPFNNEVKRLLYTASQAPWGPGRELDAKVHELHQTLILIKSRIGSAEELPEDGKMAHQIDHELRNKLMIYHYYEKKRSSGVVSQQLVCG